jgi:hypothetical protein
MRQLTWIICLAAVGCASKQQRAQPSAEALSVAYVDDVSVRADASAWSEGKITAAVTPVRVTVRNDSGRPVRIRYSDFSLTDEKGRRYSALPPFEVKTNADRPTIAGGYSPIREPEFKSSGFVVFPFYGPLYPTLATYEESYFMDPLYYTSYYAYWRQSGLPTDDMLGRALPEGVLASGGSVTGFLYFEHVPNTAGSVRFVADLVNAATNNTFGTIVIPVPIRG